MNNNKRDLPALLPLYLSLAVVLGILIGFLLPGSNDIQLHASLKARNDKVASILNIIESEYVDTVNREELETVSIAAMLAKLDPHSVYIPAKDLTRANEPLQGNFEGIGISFNILTDTILIISTIPGGPSEKIGLLPGDKILFVDDSLVAGRDISDEDVMRMLKGPRGTTVKIRILRKGYKDLLPFTITRDKIPIHSVDIACLVNNTTGYIKINNFAVTTFEEFSRGLQELKAQGMEKLIIDLRGNSGGIMEAAIQIANQFLEKDQLIVFTRGRAQPRNEARATGKGEFIRGDLAILIDEWSASASEILAGAIQDNDRGIIIGRRSFGKGLVQEPFQLPDGSGIRLTIARYYTPTGRSIQKPYNKGSEDYFYHMYTEPGIHESESPDSPGFLDSLKFMSPGGKILYGGGGIMPDVYLPVDTSGISTYFMNTRPLIYMFSLKYTENNRDVLRQFTDTRELEKFLDKQALLDKFVLYAAENRIKPDPEGIRISGNIIHTQLKAYITRNILDNNGFYPIWQKIDNTLLKAINILAEK